MPNRCVYDIRAVAKHKNTLERLIKIMRYEDPEYYIYRCFSAVDTDTYESDGYYVVDITGDVAWSCSEWFSGRESVDQTAESSDQSKSATAHYITLDLLCRKLGFGLECWSSETGVGFQEHYLVNHNGDVLISDCVETHKCVEDGCSQSSVEVQTLGGFSDFLEFRDFPEDIYGE